MKRKIFTTTALVCCFMVCLAAVVADMNGKWKGSIKAPDGNEYPVSYIFKIDGDKLTGSGSNTQGDSPITNGKVTGTEFSFNIDVNGADVPHKGKYYAEGDSIAVDIDYSGMKLHATLNRDKDSK